MESKLSEIGQIAITVSDVSVALPFYRDVLGLEFLFSPSPNLAFLSAGSIRIMLSAPQGAGLVGANSILYFKVNDLIHVFSQVVARGANRSIPSVGKPRQGTQRGLPKTSSCLIPPRLHVSARATPSTSPPIAFLNNPY